MKQQGISVPRELALAFQDGIVQQVPQGIAHHHIPAFTPEGRHAAGPPRLVKVRHHSNTCTAHWVPPSGQYI